MGLADLIRERVTGRPTIDPAKFAKAKPLRNPAVEFNEQEDGSGLLEAPIDFHPSRAVAVLAKWAKAPSTRKFELEPVGFFVWQLCDGSTTFEAISRKLRDRYKMSRLEADAALTAFLQMLSQRRLITLLVAKKK